MISFFSHEAKLRKLGQTEYVNKPILCGRSPFSPFLTLTFTLFSLSLSLSLSLAHSFNLTLFHSLSHSLSMLNAEVLQPSWEQPSLAQMSIL